MTWPDRSRFRTLKKRGYRYDRDCRIFRFQRYPTDIGIPGVKHDTVRGLYVNFADVKGCPRRFGRLWPCRATSLYSSSQISNTDIPRDNPPQSNWFANINFPIGNGLSGVAIYEFEFLRSCFWESVRSVNSRVEMSRRKNGFDVLDGAMINRKYDNSAFRMPDFRPRFGECAFRFDIPVDHRR